ncbi:MAG TPA: hypothetical protein VG939_10250 [Caulobacteraceae bacterium]|nr:hypothetical protein [Caulobacteraceae bacterium]
MPEPFSAKLELVLKILSMSRARLASEVGVDKSVAARWVSGAVRPSSHNMTQLTAMIARRIPGFTLLDWDRDLAGLAERLGADAAPLRRGPPPADDMSLVLESLPQIRATTKLRGSAYEGFYRSTRLYALQPGLVMHDHGMIRLDDCGLLRLSMVTAGMFTDAWWLPMHNQVFVIGSERATRSPVFGIFHGVGGLKAAIMDGLTLSSIHDAGRTPTASPIVMHRIGDLSGDREADDATFAAFAEEQSVATLDSIPEALRAHLCRDIGPAAAALGGELLMQMPLARSMTI